MNASTQRYTRAPLAATPYPFPPVQLMRAVSVRQPWAWLLAAGWKDIENRGWNPQFPTWLAVHAGKKIEPGLQTFFECDLGIEISMHTSAVIGAILVDACVSGSHGTDSPWYAGESGWTVKGAVLLRDPIQNVLGALGCFRLPAAAHVELTEKWAAAEHRTWRD